MILVWDDIILLNDKTGNISNLKILEGFPILVLGE